MENKEQDIWSLGLARFCRRISWRWVCRSEPIVIPKGGWHTVGLAIGSTDDPHTVKYKELLERLSQDQNGVIMEKVRLVSHALVNQYGRPYKNLEYLGQAQRGCFQDQHSTNLLIGVLRFWPDILTVMEWCMVREFPFMGAVAFFV